jgi:hypothetical protein
MTLSPDVAAQIEAAYDYRGHCTVTLVDGTVLEGFLFNREFEPLKGEPYAELILKNSDERRRLPADGIRSVALTGKDFAVPFVPPKKD